MSKLTQFDRRIYLQFGNCGWWGSFRAYHLQVNKHDIFSLSETQYLSEIIPAWRGDIIDRNGQTSYHFGHTICLCNHAKLNPVEVAKKLATVLNVDQDKLVIRFSSKNISRGLKGKLNQPRRQNFVDEITMNPID